MKILHQVGHNANWNLDSYFENNIGDGFIFCAYSIDSQKIGDKVSTYKFQEYKDSSSIDLQYYGSKNSEGGKLDTYSFHPIRYTETATALMPTTRLIYDGISFQEKLGFKNIIVPIIYKNNENINEIISLTKEVNQHIKKNKNEGFKYFMTVPFSNETILDDNQVEKILLALTDMSIIFDGYYVVCDASPGYKKKISTDYNYYKNLSRVFRTLKKQGFKLIHGYANADSLIFATLTNIDYLTIGTYENLRNFNIKRFTEDISGGPSKGWYFSESLLNFIKADELVNIRNHGCISLIQNQKNIFSDIILEPGYIWNTHKPDIHKNYLLSISRILKELTSISDINARMSLMLEKIEKAKALYAELASRGVYLADESSDYYLATWYSFLKPKIS